MAKKADLKLPPSAKMVLLTIKEAGPVTQRRIVEKTGLSIRTVKNALKALKGRSLIKEIPNFEDVRVKIYVPSAGVPSGNQVKASIARQVTPQQPLFRK